MGKERSRLLSLAALFTFGILCGVMLPVTSSREFTLAHMSAITSCLGLCLVGAAWAFRTRNRKVRRQEPLPVKLSRTPHRCS